MNVSNAVVVSGGDGHSSALAADRTVWKWGLNDVGELGNGTTNGGANSMPAPNWRIMYPGSTGDSFSIRST